VSQSQRHGIGRRISYGEYKGGLVFIDPGAKVSSSYYRNVLLVFYPFHNRCYSPIPEPLQKFWKGGGRKTMACCHLSQMHTTNAFYIRKGGLYWKKSELIGGGRSHCPFIWIRQWTSWPFQVYPLIQIQCNILYVSLVNLKYSHTLSIVDHWCITAACFVYSSLFTTIIIIIIIA